MSSNEQHVTGNDPASGADPGGTHPTKSPNVKPAAENVQSGDRNQNPSTHETRIEKS